MVDKDQISLLLGSIRHAYAAQKLQSSEEANELLRIRGLLDELPLVHVDLQARTQPVCRYLDESMTLAENEITAPVTRALRPLAAALHWNQDYKGGEELKPFFENFAYSEIIGPRGLVFCDILAVGFVLLGPHTFYPPHCHPAIELYLVLGGNARWKRGGENWKVRPPGSFIFHPSGISHSMQTDREPLLALYSWRDHLDVPSKLI